MVRFGYTLRKNKESEELHLFRGIKKTDRCNPDEEALCGAVGFEDTEAIQNFVCLDEESTRIEAAKIGRKVCSNCIKTFYATYN